MSFKTYAITKRYIYQMKPWFYIENTTGSDATVTLTLSMTISYIPTPSVEISYDGKSWSEWTKTGNTFTAGVNANSKVYFRSSTTNWGGGDSGWAFSCNAAHNVGGNILSLNYGSNFTGEETTVPQGSYGNFTKLFYQDSTLVDASALVMPSGTLGIYACRQMFEGCSSLTSAPSLPATQIDGQTYYQMFYNCTSLSAVTAMALNAGETNNGDYNMVRGCQYGGVFTTSQEANWGQANGVLQSGWSYNYA